MVLFLPAFLAGWAFTLALLIIFHLLFDTASEEIRYCLGAGAICVGCALAGLILNAPLLTFGPAVITSSGLIIIVWQHVEQRVRAHKTSAERRGEVVGMARGLTQELIDQGGRRDAHRSGQERQN